MATAATTTIIGCLRTSTTSTQEVVQSLNSHIISNASKKNNILWETWNELFAVAGETPSGEQGKLVEFLEKLRKSGVKTAAGQAYEAEEGDPLWAKLPKFGWVAREVWNFDIHDPKATPQDIETFNNHTAFLARLTAQSNPDDKNDPFDYSLYALWSMRDAFEEDSPGSGDADPAVRNAAIWAVLAGDVLRRLSSEGKDANANSGAGGKKFADKGWKGFNAERYNVWKAGFEGAADGVEEAKDAASALKTLS